jgi:small GTP-binding protein
LIKDANFSKFASTNLHQNQYNSVSSITISHYKPYKSIQMTNPSTLRIIVIGDAGVGKTQMMMRYCEDSFSATGTTTVGVDFKMKWVSLDGVSYKIQIWDTAGQERFRNIVENYYRRAQGILLVYDVSKRDTFDSLPEWLSSIEKFAVPGTPVIICGNKNDLAAAVDLDVVETFASEKGLSVFLTSASNGEGIGEAFQTIAQKVVQGGSAAKSGAPEVAPTPTPTPATAKAKKGGLCSL